MRREIFMEENVERKEESFFVKHRKLIFEIIRFLLVGGFATLVDWAISFFVTSITPSVMVGSLDITHTVLSTACGFSIGLLVNYFLSVIFVFI